MIVTTAYPYTSFKVPYLHNLFQNGAATLSGLAEICYRKQERGEIPAGDIVFIMVSEAYRPWHSDFLPVLQGFRLPLS